MTDRVSSFVCRLQRMRVGRALGLTTSALSATLSLIACAPTTAEKQSATSDVRYPQGVAIDGSNAKRIKGIYTGDALCCWLTDRAEFSIPVKVSDAHIVLKVYAPLVKAVSSTPGSISIVGRSSRMKATQSFHAGAQSIELPILPGTVNDGLLSVRLEIRPAFVPKEIGLNADVRKLSIVLESVEAT